MALETIEASIYDYPQYYDVLFGADWREEFEFLEACFTRYAQRKVRRLYEPGCGTGRLLLKFAEAGYRVAGSDLNPHAVAYSNSRLKKRGFPESVTVADMSDFRVRAPYDAAFNTINTFRHLSDDDMARRHLQCMAAAVAPGGLYVLGLHLTPRGEPECVEEKWSARRGAVAIRSTMRTVGLDRQSRREQITLTFDVTTPKRKFRLADAFVFRTWSRRQMAALIASVPEWETVATFDFGYDVDAPIKVDDQSEDVLFVFHRR